MTAVIEIVRALRNIRAERKTDVTSWLEAQLYTGTLLDEFQDMLPAIESLSRTRILSLEHSSSRPEASPGQVALILTDAEVLVAASSAEEGRRLQEQLLKEAAATRARLEPIERRLDDPSFLSKAPTIVVDRQRKLAQSLRNKLDRLTAELTDVG